MPGGRPAELVWAWPTEDVLEESCIAATVPTPAGLDGNDLRVLPMPLEDKPFTDRDRPVRVRQVTGDLRVCARVNRGNIAKRAPLNDRELHTPPCAIDGHVVALPR